SAHVLDAAVGVAGDAEGGSEVGRGIEARRRDRYRQAREPARRLEIFSGKHDLLAARGCDHGRRKRLSDRTHPRLADVLDRLAHADGIDRGRGRKRADHHRNVVPPALGVDHVGEQESAPLVLRDAAEELPAHQRMQLGILVDGAIDAEEQPVRLEIRQMLLEVEPRAFVQAGALRSDGLIEHFWAAPVPPAFYPPTLAWSSWNRCPARRKTL